mmetsp:Transcript_7136/g.8841  ORF Transcript_7136/g.8841 Transcript_7136/m.8841 type:complete len:151 (-) Transcript_7136:34-486(-)|eukprot:CAMPEP_0206191080 /NCGR_PEP_ID=MMETSP0166-20121206/5145_1 /ASSEMBLY_ACC=CAM_ASM_000260 /TAXON_ID=95228 /ORGANISM="Vannella robusta, Strain DIVA3 518/3/11/1/6" /LENGTH=150 /DNA_ID=CAMNT_0053607307 /DNA_START=308 /DNA_END=760 /DNA_ORIENTATION=+
MNEREREQYEHKPPNICASTTCTAVQETKKQSGLLTFWYLENSSCVALIVLRVQGCQQKLVATKSSELVLEFRTPAPPNGVIRLVDMPLREAVEQTNDRKGKITFKVKEGSIQRCTSLWKIETKQGEGERTSYAVYTIPKLSSLKNYSII